MRPNFHTLLSTPLATTLSLCYLLSLHIFDQLHLAAENISFSDGWRYFSWDKIDYRDTHIVFVNRSSNDLTQVKS